jgi:A/G-specific adenine glycosylase
MATKRTAPRPGSPALPTAEWKQSFQRQALAWYGRHQRDLPWRRSSDPYVVWVSEIMLQQTQVATVVPYFTRFMAQFPTVRALAEADEQAVLRQWEGLGYYRRARQLHRAARIVVEQFDGQFPRDLDSVRSLPGIGRYTAGAIVSIAFDTPAPILEANTVRLFSRLIGVRDAPASSAAQALLWQLAEAVVPRRRCGAFNQALMELGSLLCTPRAPRCHECPVSGLCAAFRSGDQERIPKPRASAQIEDVREAAVVVRRGVKVLLRRCTVDERWGGLWDFLRFPLVARRGSSLQTELVEKIERHSGLVVEPPCRIATLKHGVTRFRITLDCYLAESTDAKRKLAAGTWKWVRLDDLEQFPLSVTGRKLARLIVDLRRVTKPAVRAGLRR